jgi:hypothetical protein
VGQTFLSVIESGSGGILVLDVFVGCALAHADRKRADSAPRVLKHTLQGTGPLHRGDCFLLARITYPAVQ